jgi:uncharacterized protein
MSPPTVGITTADIRIPSHGEQLAAYLYRPAGPGPVPCVVMAHGFSGTRDDALPGYAEAFAAAGMAAVVFDYRHFGASGGEPRQLLDIARQQQDYRAVVAWARSAEGIDPDRIALWGTSFSGGHVLAVAAADPGIAAVVSQCPFTDSVAAISRLPLRTIIRGSALAVRDIAGARRGLPPRYLPAVGARGSFAVMTAPDALPGFRSMLGPRSHWRNEVAARIVVAVAAYRPGRSAGRLSMPVLFCVCDNDSTTPPGPTRRAARAARRGELRSYPYGHFDVYHDPQAKADQVEFLTRVLGAPARAPAGERAADA